MLQRIEGIIARGCPIKFDIRFAQVSQGVGQVSIALNGLVEEVSKAKELQNLTQA